MRKIMYSQVKSAILSARSADGQTEKLMDAKLLFESTGLTAFYQFAS